MKTKFSVMTAGAAFCAMLGSPAYAAADYDYFKSQSCSDLRDELAALQKAEKAINEKKDKADGKATTQAVVTTLLVGWPFWGNVDHGDSNNQLAEIRNDIKYVTRAQKANKCS